MSKSGSMSDATDARFDAAERIGRRTFDREALPSIVTTSWDDGSPLDFRIAELLAERKLPGTFYIPLRGHHKSMCMEPGAVVELDRLGFEIGAHGISRPNLAECEPWQLEAEVEISKKRIEDNLGKRVWMFAYPRGRHNGHVVAAVRKAGFTGARTTAMLSCNLSIDPFRMPTSVHAFPHSRLDYLRNLAREADWSRARVYAKHLRSANSWVALAKLLFNSVLRGGGLWHIYGHSWEIEEFGLWDELKDVLNYVSGRPDVLYLENSSIVNLAAAIAAEPASSLAEAHSAIPPRL